MKHTFDDPVAPEIDAKLLVTGNILALFCDDIICGRWYVIYNTPMTVGLNASHLVWLDETTGQSSEEETRVMDVLAEMYHEQHEMEYRSPYWSMGAKDKYGACRAMLAEYMVSQYCSGVFTREPQE